MKRLICLLLMLMLLLTGCDRAPVALFPDAPVTAITLYALPEASVDVPEAHLDEVTLWLRQFMLGDVLRKPQPPGANTFSVTCTYADGSTFHTGIDATTWEGRTYAIDRPPLPACWEALWDEP